MPEVNAAGSGPGLLRPSQGFAAGAAASLAPVARELDTVSERVRDGTLRLDTDAAQRLLERLEQLHTRVNELIAHGESGINQRLRFGHNIVGRSMSRRLEEAAAGDTDAAMPVLRQFLAQIEKMQDIVSRAATRLAQTDDDAVEALGALGVAEEGELR